MNYLRGAIIKKTEKFGENSEISDFFEFQTFLKIADISDFPTFLIKVILQNNCKIIEIGTILKN